MNPPKHLLIIRFSAMGDVAMMVPVISILRRAYPEIKITILSRAFFKPMFSGIPNIGFLEADLKGKHKRFGIFKLAQEAKAMGIDAIADLHEVLRTKLLKSYFFAYGIRIKSIDKGRREKKLLTSGQPSAFKQLKTTHQRYADVFAELGLPISLNEYVAPAKMHLTPRLNAMVGVEVKKWIGIAPFAAHQGKMYPQNLMKEVIEHLDRKNAYKIFLFGGGKKESELLTKWETPCGSVTSVAGKVDFKEELILISNLDLMVSMDSGNGHLAAIYGVPVLTLWGVTHPYAGFAPFNQPQANQITADRNKYPKIPTSIYGNKMPIGYEKAMETIRPEDVVHKVETLLLKKKEH